MSTTATPPPSPARTLALRCSNLHRFLGHDEGRVHVLKGVSFEANRGQVLAFLAQGIGGEQLQDIEDADDPVLEPVDDEDHPHVPAEEQDADQGDEVGQDERDDGRDR